MSLHDIIDRLSTFARLEIVDETIVTDITALCLEDNTYPVSWFAACSSCSLCTYGTTSEKVKYSWTPDANFTLIPGAAPSAVGRTRILTTVPHCSDRNSSNPTR